MANQDSYESLLAELNDFSNTLKKPATPPRSLATDLGHSLLAGMAGIPQVGGYALEKTGLAPQLGKNIQQTYSQAAAMELAARSPQAQQEAAKQIIDSETGGYGGYSLESLGHQAVQSLPGMLTMALPGTGAAKVLQGLKIPAYLATGIGQGMSEGVFSGAQNASDIGLQIKSTPIDKLKLQNPQAFTEARAQTQTDEQARELLGNKASSDIFAKTALTTGGISALTGGGILGSLQRGVNKNAQNGIVKSLLKGTGEEAAQETPQSGTEQFYQNQALKNYANANQDPMQNVWNAAIEGGLVGGALGLTGASVGTFTNKPQQNTVADNFHTSGNQENTFSQPQEIQNTPIQNSPLSRAIAKATIETQVTNQPNTPIEITNNLQNRDRGSVDSILQMQKITNAPDYTRAGIGSGMSEAAPLVSIKDNAITLPSEQIGKADNAVLADGTKIPFHYAVVSADNVITSHDSSGNPNQDYVNPKPGSLIALNNGRTAAIKASYNKGTAGNYTNALLQDDRHGINQETLATIKNPLLIRLYDHQKNNEIPNIGALSNTRSSAALSTLEQAKTDSARLPITIADNAQNNDLTHVNNNQFVQTLLGALPESERGALIDSQGLLNQTGKNRLSIALAHKAYDSTALIKDAFESTDPSIKSIANALINTAPDILKIKSAVQKGEINQEWDLSEAINTAIAIVLHAKKPNSLSVKEQISQKTLNEKEEVSPKVAKVLHLFFKGDHLEKQKSRQEIENKLNQYTQAALQQANKTDSLINEPLTPDVVLQLLNSPAQQQIKTNPVNQENPNNRVQNNIRYSIAPDKPSTATTVLKPQTIKILSERLFSRLRLHKSGKLSLIIHNTESTLPEPIKKQIQRDNAQGSIRGVYYDGTIHIIASNIKSELEIEEVILHEAFGHYGVRSLFGQDIDRALKRLFIKLGNEKGVKALAEKYGINLDAYFEIAADKSPQYRAIMLTDELLAHLQGAKVYQTLPQKIKTALQEFWGALRAIFKRAGFQKFQDFTDTDLAYLLKRMAKSAQTGKSTGKFSNENNDIRYSLASDTKDFFTGKPKTPKTLSQIITQLNNGQPTREKPNNQYYKDLLVTKLSDSSRPFDRWIMNTFESLQAQQLISAKDRAQGIKQAYEKEVMDKFGRPLADAIRAIKKTTKMDFQTIKDMAGFWMTTVYAPEANAWLLEKDQKSIEDLEQEKQNIIETYSTITPTEQDTQEYNAQIIRLDKAITQAQEKLTHRRQAINRQEFVDLPQIIQDLVELRKDRVVNAAEITRLENILKENEGLAGGLNNFTAQKMREHIESKIPLKLLENTAKPIYAMLKWKLEHDINDGKVSQETVDSWLKSPHYVPLTGDPRTDHSVEDFFTVGNINQEKDHALKGRTSSIAQNAIDAAFEQVEKSARYHGWNEFKNSLHNTYNSMLADRVAQGLTQQSAISEIWDEYGIKRRPADTQITASENDIIYRKDNKGFIYTINNQAAMHALRSMNDEKTPSILKPFQAFTGLQAKLVTIMMLGFAPTNSLKDTLEKSENIRTRKIAGHNIDMNQVGRDTLLNAARLLTRLKLIASVLAEDTPLSKFLTINDQNDTDVKQLKEYLKLGGSATHGDFLAKNSQQLAEKLKNINTKLDKGFDVILLYNNSFEVISGFSIYQSLLKQGIEPKIAASQSLNLMNFRKQGEILSPLRALYMFINPVVQGAHQLTKTLSTRTGKMRFAGYTIAAFFLYSILRSLEGDDDELGFNRMDEQSNFTLYRNIFIPTGNGEYLKIPIGFGLQQLAWAHGVNLVRMNLGKMTTKEFVGESLGLWERAVMPVAPAESSIANNPTIWLMQTFSPQLVKPIVNIALDRNAFGTPLTVSRYEKTDTAHALQGKQKTPPEYKKLALFFAEHGIDSYPEQIKEFVNGYFIGYLGDIIKVLIENPTAEKFGKNIVNPSLNRWLVANNDDMIKERIFYRLRDNMNEASIKRSVGSKITEEEIKKAALNDIVKRMENKTRGKFAAATRAEKLGQLKQAENLRKQAEQERLRYINLTLKTLG